MQCERLHLRHRFDATRQLLLLRHRAVALLKGAPGFLGGDRLDEPGSPKAACSRQASSLPTGTFTGGEDGIQQVPRGVLFGFIDLKSQMTMYYVKLAIFLGTLLFVHRVLHSPFGEVLKAIRENEARAISLGYKTDRYKLLVFVLSASVAGVGGATKALVFQLASLLCDHRDGELLRRIWPMGDGDPGLRVHHLRVVSH